MENDVDGTVTS